jgi:hypothetical protein
MRMGTDAREVIPALLEVSTNTEERDDIASLADQALGTYNAHDFVDAFTKALGDKGQPGVRRGLICRMLTGLYKAKPTTSEERETIVKALEETLTDGDPQNRLTAAIALEIIDAENAIPVLLNAAVLARLKLQPEDARDAIKAKFPKARVELSPDKRMMKFIMTGAGWETASALGSVLVSPPERETIPLRELALIGAEKALAPKAVTQSVHALFDPAVLKQFKVQPEQVRDALTAKFPGAQVQLSPNKRGLQISMTGAGADWAAALGTVPISPRAGETVTLREIATLEAQVRGKR